ncbi:uncharacterized protein MONBRDRAFT_6225, partial [Monosiga brevicollis MX1]
MPMTKEEALRALKLLTDIRNSVPSEETAPYDALIDVMQSRLFVALLELQDFYFDRVVHRSSASGASPLRPRISSIGGGSSVAPQDLEWEHDYDVGAGTSSARGDAPSDNDSARSPGGSVSS